MERDARGRRIVDEQKLLDYYRARLNGWPIWQNKVRRELAEAEGKDQ